MKNTILLVCCISCLAISCAKEAAQGDDKGQIKDPIVNITDEMKACVKDDDCVKLESPCCQCGEPDYVNKTFQKDVSAMIDNACKMMDEEGSACTAMYCVHKEAACVENKCVANATDSGGGGEAAQRWEIPSWLTPDMSACLKNEDCIISSWGCCDYCNGSKPVSINNASLAAVDQINDEMCDENTACTLKGCVAPAPICFNNKCDMFSWDDLDISSPVNHCNADGDCAVMEMACCDHCNGGTAAGVNNAYTGALTEYKKQFFCVDPCTKVECSDLSARCAQNRCETFTP